MDLEEKRKQLWLQARMLITFLGPDEKTPESAKTIFEKLFGRMPDELEEARLKKELNRRIPRVVGVLNEPDDVRGGFSFCEVAPNLFRIMKLDLERKVLGRLYLSQREAWILSKSLQGFLTKEAPGSEALNQIRDGIMTEVGNIILNAIMGSFGNILEVPFNFKIPLSYEGKISAVYQQLDKEKFSQILICRTNTCKTSLHMKQVWFVYLSVIFQKHVHWGLDTF